MNDKKDGNIKTENIIKDVISKNKPLVLFLGQDYAYTNKGDPVLAKVISHLNIENEGNESWLSLLKSNKVTKETYEWLAERFERTTQTDFIDNIFQLSWSAVFTTSIDPQIAKKIESRGR
ncbi:hypothetical protein, partial [Klebsiella pneumoniae]|uniref:hypothetical protein n=3 Tax=Klebsiella/Raoultella group TaxID=2890311 RepID=UPI002553E4AE